MPDSSSKPSTSPDGERCGGARQTIRGSGRQEVALDDGVVVGVVEYIRQSGEHLPQHRRQILERASWASPKAAWAVRGMIHVSNGATAVKSWKATKSGESSTTRRPELALQQPRYIWRADRSCSPRPAFHSAGSATVTWGARVRDWLRVSDSSGHQSAHRCGSFAKRTSFILPEALTASDMRERCPFASTIDVGAHSRETTMLSALSRNWWLARALRCFSQLCSVWPRLCRPVLPPFMGPVRVT